MPHINVDKNLPGIRSLMAFSPETATPMGELANSLLRINEGLSMAEREMIASHVSYLNDCFYCQQSHGAIAACYLDGDNELVEQVKKDYTHADIPDKLKALLAIAGSVQKGGKHVTSEQVELAKVLALPIKTYMIQCLLPRFSACSTAMLTGLQPIHRLTFL